MAKRKSKNQQRVGDKARHLRAQFGNYQDAVLLISSLEAWFNHNWGEGGLDPGRMQLFDRFPEVDGLTPDFIVYFNTPYVLCGEYIRTFRSGTGAKEDAQQVMAYAKWQPPAEESGKPVSRDVVVLADTHSDDKAAKTIDRARQEQAAGQLAPIVVVGYYRQERANGEWFSLKWRDHYQNCRFSVPNCSLAGNAKDLNGLIIDQDPCPIRVDYSAVEGTERNPLINDEPPELYTIVRIIFPAFNQLMTDEERDMLIAENVLTKLVTRKDILSAPMLRDLKIRDRYIQKALDLLERIGVAKKMKDTTPAKYAIKIDFAKIADLLDWIPEKQAREMLRSLRSRKSGRSRRPGDMKGQLKFFD